MVIADLREREARSLTPPAPEHPPGSAMARDTASRRALVVLAIGAAAGVVLAASGLVHIKPNAASLPQGAVAKVNGEVVRSEDYERTVAGLASDRRDGITAEDRRHVVDRLIDEELLVQRGVELGLARRDRKVRADLTAGVIASIVADTEDLQPTAAELQAFYDENRTFFARPGRLRLRQIFVHPAAGGDDAARARDRSESPATCRRGVRRGARCAR